MTFEQELSFSILCSQNGWHKARIQGARDEIRNLIEQQAKRIAELERLNLSFAQNEQNIEALRGFAQDIMEFWPHSELDGCDLQTIAENHGLLEPETRTERCGENCECDIDAPVWVCYRKTELLTGQ